MSQNLPPQLSRQVDKFLAQMTACGRLIFALDATASRQPTWDAAVELQAEMFAEAAKVGGLQVQLVFFRGNKCLTSDWSDTAHALADKMRRISCVAGATQIGRVRREHMRRPVGAAVFVGDCCEESPGGLYDLATGLGAPLFVFQEGVDPTASIVFPELARRTKGAFAKFDSGAARELADLLRAVAAFAAGGVKALTDIRTEGARKLLTQLK
jgi:hypothetical protein